MQRGRYQFHIQASDMVLDDNSRFIGLKISPLEAGSKKDF